MKLVTHIKKLFGLDTNDDHLWLNAEVVSDLNMDTFIENTQLIKGNSGCNLILKPNVNIDIEGVFQGKIVGQGGNTIRIKGELDGIILCDKTIFLEGSKMDGITYTNQMVVPKNNYTFNGTVRSLPIPYLGDKMDFEYVTQLK